MTTPLDDLRARLTELRADFSFVIAACQLRPRLGEVLQWGTHRDVLQLAQKFMNEKSARPEGVYGPLLLRLVAVFERFLRMLIAEIIDHRASNAKTFDDLPRKVVNRNITLTGKLLAAHENPRDHLSFNTEALITNLATCRSGNSSFVLNPHAFSAAVIGVTPDLIDRALNNLDIADCWDAIGAHTALARLLGTNGARATATRANERLKELSRWRNHLAHGGDEIVVSEAQLRDAVDFVDTFTTALDAAVKQQLDAI